MRKKAIVYTITVLLRIFQHPAAIITLATLYPRTTAENLAQSVTDGRAARLEKFFKSYDCPQPYYIGDYLRAADDHAIDYRILPAVSVRESTCGQYDHRNNRWGWDSARTGFQSVPSGIDFVASHLAEGFYYQGKTLDEKLYTYNPDPRYVREVKQLMREIDRSVL